MSAVSESRAYQRLPDRGVAGPSQPTPHAAASPPHAIPPASALAISYSPPMTRRHPRPPPSGTSSSKALTDSALHQLAKLVTDRTFECDDVLFEEGAPPRVHGDPRQPAPS